MNRMKIFLKRFLAFGISFMLMCGLLSSLNITQAEAKSKIKRPGKPVISVAKGDSATDVVLTISKTKKAEGFVVYVKKPGSKKYEKIKTLKQDGTTKRTLSIDGLDKQGTYYFKVRSYYKSGKSTVYSLYSKVKKYKVTDAITENLKDLNSGEYPVYFTDRQTVFFGHYPYNVTESSMVKTKVYDYYEDYMHDRDAWAGRKTEVDPNGKLDRIEWEIIDEREDSYLLMSKYVIDVVPMAGKASLCYFTTIEDDENYSLYDDEQAAIDDGKILTWEDTNLRKWLNKEFIEYAFTSDERNYLLQMQVDACGENEGTCNDYVTIPSSDNLLKYLNPKNSGKYYWDLIAYGTPFSTYSQKSEEVGPNRGNICDETYGYRVLRRIYHSNGSSTKYGYDWSGDKLDKATYESLGCPSDLLDRKTVSYWLRDVDLSKHDELYNTNASFADPYYYDARYTIYKVVSYDGRITSLRSLSLLNYSNSDSLRNEGNLSLVYDGGYGTGMSGVRPIILVAKDKIDAIITSSGRGGTIGSTGKRYGGNGSNGNGSGNNNQKEDEKYTVEFMPNGGTGTMKPETVKKGTYKLPKCKFKKNGYEFIGWQVGGGETLQPGDTINVEANVVLFAQWKEKVKLSSAYVYFGHYEQDGNKSNGKEPIEWMVLEDKGDTLVLMSKDILVHRVLNEDYSYDAPVTWENCETRKWLNKTFLKDAFTEAERESIKNRKWESDDNPNPAWPRSGGEDVKDKVSILSLEEVKKYFAGEGFTQKNNLECYNWKLCALPSNAIAKSDKNKEGLILEGFIYFSREFYQEIGYPEDVLSGKYSGWWLRSPGTGDEFMLYVSPQGGIDASGSECTTRLQLTYGLRPVIEVSANAVSDAKNVKK